jgi:Uma2 family endonuclease
VNDLTRLSTSYAPARFSVEQFQRMVDVGVFDGTRVELVEGEIVQMSPAMPRHVLIQRQVFRDLDHLVDGIDDLFASFEHTVRFGERTLRDIDVALVTSLEDTGDYFAPSTVLLAIEVASTTLASDLNEKRIEYARAGIPHYWVVDVANGLVHIMSAPLGGDYTERRPARFGEAIPVPGTTGTLTIA